MKREFILPFGVRNLFLAFTLTILAVPAAVRAQESTSIREPRPVRERTWSALFAYQKDQLTRQPADVCFVGDSLTEFWGVTGKSAWDAAFKGYRAVNFGIAADRLENIFFRLKHASLAAHPPRVFVLLVGTNNLASDPPDPPEEVARGIEAMVEYLGIECPASAVVLLTLPPNGYAENVPLRKRVITVNDLIKKTPVTKRVTLLDIYPSCVDAQHRWKPELTIDGTHFSAKGYVLLAEMLKPVLDSLLKKE